MSIADEIGKLDQLRQSGAITDDEYQAAKATLLSQQAGAGTKPTGTAVTTTAKPIDEKTWTVLLHLSQLCGFIVPFAGLVVPIILWQVKKDESALIDRHGRAVANWLLTVLIAGIVFFALSFLLIGLPMLVILALLCIVFPIIGGIKASNGELWSYPMSYKFFPETA